MKLFHKRVFIFSFSFFIIYGVFYFFLDQFNNKRNPGNSVFIWGDSQAYQGIDINELREKTQKNIYTAAKHGAGMYDFLVFVDRVPVSSTVLIAISKPAQIRSKSRDRNMGPLSVAALNILINNNYKSSEIFTIVKNNIGFPENLYMEETFLYEYSDSIKFNEPLELFINSYKKIPSHLENKQNIYVEGIKILKNKNCTIHLISFPYFESLTKIESKSPIKNKTDQFFKEVVKLINVNNIDTLHLDTNKQVMHDLTHLNNYGAKQVSIFLSENIIQNEPSAIFISN